MIGRTKDDVLNSVFVQSPMIIYCHDTVVCLTICVSIVVLWCRKLKVILSCS